LQADADRGRDESRGVTRPATPADLDVAVETLVESHRDYVWETWAVPGPDRGLQLDRIYRLDLERVAIPAGDVWIHDDGAAVAVWHRPGDPPLDGITQTELDALGVEILGERRAIIEEVERRIAARRPPGPHWHLGTMGTRAARRRQGCGTAVLRPVLDQLDTIGATAYLETSAPANLAFYAGLGFTIVMHLDDLPHDAPPTWGMQRSPTIAAAGVSGRRTG
jgi:GNAT superfamily N-acetyltransferase